MSEDDVPKQIRFEGPTTKEDWEQAQQVAADPAEVARLLAKERLAREAASTAFDQLEKNRIETLSGLVNNNVYIAEFDKLLGRLNSEHPRAGYPDGAFQFMLDIRKMHDINNRQGGQAEGDKVIAIVGELLRDTFRMDEGDIVARTGGDEFSVVTPYFLVHADGKSHTPSDIKELLWERLTSKWLELKAEGGVDFDLLVHFAPVERAKSREDTRRDADPKNHWDQAMVLGDSIEPYPEVEKRENLQNHQPKRENYFGRIFKRRTQLH